MSRQINLTDWLVYRVLNYINQNMFNVQNRYAHNINVQNNVNVGSQQANFAIKESCVSHYNVNVQNL